MGKDTSCTITSTDLTTLDMDDLGPRGVLTYMTASDITYGTKSHSIRNALDMHAWVAPVSIKAHAGWEATKSIPAKVSTASAFS